MIREIKPGFDQLMAFKITLFFASLNGALAVMAGAFGAHALRGKLSDNLLNAWQTGVHYHLIHVLALLAVALLMRTQSKTEALVSGQLAGLTWSAGLFALGIVLFSGSLYGLALGGPRWLGPVTPLGGVCLIAAWCVLAYAALR